MHPHTSRKLTIPGIPGGQSRRSFLRGSTLVTAAAVPALIVAECSETKAATLKPSSAMATNFREIRDDEDDHVKIIQTLLVDPDNPLNPQIRQPPVMQNLLQPNLSAFIQAASAFENTGSGTYGGALLAIQQTPEYFPIAVGLTTAEARHASYLNSLLGLPLLPDNSQNGVELPIPQNLTLTRVAPFIASLNGNHPMFDPVNASDPNNFAILDFLLLLEYIERSFYIVNVLHFFGG